MRLGQRLVWSLFVAVVVVSLLFAAYGAYAEVDYLKAEIQRQALVLAASQQKRAEIVLQRGTRAELQDLVDDMGGRGAFNGAAVYGADGAQLAITSSMDPEGLHPPRAVQRTIQSKQSDGQFFQVRGQTVYALTLPLWAGDRLQGVITVYQGVGLLAAPVWRHALWSVLQALVLAAITLLLVRWSLNRPFEHMAEWLRDLRTGKMGADHAPPQDDMFRPLAAEVKQLATSLEAARAAAEEEARLRDAALALWTPERLRIAMQGKLQGSRLFAVSNREPYEHNRKGSEITWTVPASGLVTALEPVLRACDGTWVAQSSGDADVESSDDRGRLRVPPDRPQYTLRRVWLSAEEEEGFYSGFSNEGLWPLCHIAHTRPQFRASDWEQYLAVNRKFAAALLDEMRDEVDPVVLVQDYHFALLPKMIKDERPDARVSIFWHIPWPNPEAFAICPWRRELLDGMLGADLIGFHIQAHCNNFLETVDSTLETRIDWEHFAVNRNNHITTVKPFPISVAFDGVASAGPTPDREVVMRQLGISAQYLGIGVDRVDYTKGIPERLRGVERLMDRHPEYREKFTFVQIGAPSRSHIRKYQELLEEVEMETDRINRRFQTPKWKPIVFLHRNHSHSEIMPYYKLADVCMVTSLHDGMNLVAKEYIASRDDNGGVLILSRFTGASHELHDALVVNPYDTEELAAAIHTALSMPQDERHARMSRMRSEVREFNVYRWAGDLISELAGIRLPKPAPPGEVTHPHAGHRGRLSAAVH